MEYQLLLSLNLQQQKIKDVFNKIVEDKLNRTTANKIMKPMNLNGDTTNLTLDTDFTKREIASNESQEENLDACFRNKDIIDTNPLLDVPNCVVSYRQICFNKCI